MPHNTHNTTREVQQLARRLQVLIREKGVNGVFSDNIEKNFSVLRSTGSLDPNWKLNPEVIDHVRHSRAYTTVDHIPDGCMWEMLHMMQPCEDGFSFKSVTILDFTYHNTEFVEQILSV